MAKAVEPGDIEPYRDPVDMAEADRMRVELAGAVNLIQSQLANSAEGSRMTRREYLMWRKRAVVALTHRLDWLRRVNQWIKDNANAQDAAKKNELLTESGGARPLMKACGSSLHELFLYARGLEEEVQRLQAENTTLRNMLAAPEPEAPGEGVDEWREVNR